MWEDERWDRGRDENNLKDFLFFIACVSLARRLEFKHMFLILIFRTCDISLNFTSRGCLTYCLLTAGALRCTSTRISRRVFSEVGA